MQDRQPEQQGRVKRVVAPVMHHEQTGTTFENWLFRAVIAIVALAPMPLASNRPLPAALLALVTGLLLLAYGFHRTSPRQSAVPAKWLRVPLILYGAACLWIAIQAMPLPGFAAALWADPIWAEAGKALGRDLTGHISVNPNETLNGLMRLLTYAAIFWLTLQLTRQSGRARNARNAIIWIGFVYAFYGLLVYYSGNDWILLWRKWAYHDALTSTFVNRNSFATFIGLCLLCTLAPVAEFIQQQMHGSSPLRIRFMRTLERLFLTFKSNLLISFILLAALLSTASRAGVAVTGIAAILLIQISGGKRSSRSLRSLILLAGLGGLIIIGLLAGGNRLAARYINEGVSIDDDNRAAVYMTVLSAIQSTPWTGTGFGTFSDVFPAYRNGERIHTHLWDKAHNTYLENALELGLPAASALVLAISLLAWRCGVGMLKRRKDAGFAATGLAASILVGLHALVDFSLQIPAVSILYAFIMGLAISQSWSTNKTGNEKLEEE
tara:strand:- start:102554 stop:104038 length:1485 start_codon:yes stop_codon:yes gene_type:complete